MSDMTDWQETVTERLTSLDKQVGAIHDDLRIISSFIQNMNANEQSVPKTDNPENSAVRHRANAATDQTDQQLIRY